MLIPRRVPNPELRIPFVVEDHIRDSQTETNGRVNPLVVAAAHEVFEQHRLADACGANKDDLKVMFGEWLHLLKRHSIRGSCIGLDEHLCTQAHGTHYLGRSTESATAAEGDQKGGRFDHLTRAGARALGK